MRVTYGPEADAAYMSFTTTVAGVALFLAACAPASNQAADQDGMASPKTKVTHTRTIYPPKPKPSPSPSTRPAPAALYTENDPEYKLASIDAGFPLDVSDPVIDNYADVLDSLSQKCKEGPTTLGDMAVVARDLLKKKGVSLSLLKVLQSVDKSIPKAAPRMPCADIFASLVVLIGGA
jgi:hypothetical protein